MYSVDEDEAIEYFQNLKRICPEMFRSSCLPDIIDLDVDDGEGEDDEEFRKLCSKFGGNKPFRTNNFQWPKCHDCSLKKSFLCQINIGQTPSVFKEHIRLSSG